MTQQNEAIRLAVRGLEKIAALPTDVQARLIANNTLKVLRPLLDQTSAGVGDLHRRIDWTSCACQFNEHDNQTKWCSVHAELRDEVARLRALTQADQPADKDDRREAIVKQLQGWLDFNPGDDDTHIMTPPVWPTRGVIKNWISALSGSDGRE